MKKKILKLATFIFLSIICGAILQNTAINSQPVYAQEGTEVLDTGASSPFDTTQVRNGEEAIQNPGNVISPNLNQNIPQNTSNNASTNTQPQTPNEASRLQQEADRQFQYAKDALKNATQAEQLATEAERLANEAKQNSLQAGMQGDEEAMGQAADEADAAKAHAKALKEEATKLRAEAIKAQAAAEAAQQASIDANWKPLKPTLIPKPDLLPGPGTNAQKDANSGAKSILVDTILPNLTLGMIGFGGLWALVFLIVGSVRFMTSYGNEESAKKAKEQIVYSIVGFMIALLAYAIVTIIINLRIEGNTSRPTSFIETAYAEKLCSPPCGNDKVCVNGTCIKQIDALMSRPGETSAGQKYKDTKAVANLPSVTIENIFTTVIKSVLGWSMILTIIAIVVAAVFYLTSQGKEENTTKAKGILINLLIGLAIMAAAYGIVTGIAQFNFFTAAPQ